MSVHGYYLKRLGEIGDDHVIVYVRATEGGLRTAYVVPLNDDDDTPNLDGLLRSLKDNGLPLFSIEQPEPAYLSKPESCIAEYTGLNYDSVKVCKATVVSEYLVPMLPTGLPDMAGLFEYLQDRNLFWSAIDHPYGTVTMHRSPIGGE